MIDPSRAGRIGQLVLVLLVLARLVFWAVASAMGFAHADVYALPGAREGLFMVLFVTVYFGVAALVGHIVGYGAARLWNSFQGGTHP